MDKVNYKNNFRRYLRDLSAKSSTPGGGSAASLVFCLGVSLIQMAVNFSMNKNEKELKKALLHLEKIKSKILSYVDLDGKAFEKALMAKGKRKKLAYRNLDNITFDLGKNCIKILEVAKDVRIFIKKSIVSDFYVGLSFVRGALFSSVKNLEANSSSFALKNKKRIDYLKGYLEEFRKWLIY